MLNYSLDTKDADKFILNYEIINNSIKINYASGENLKLPYTQEIETRILKTMEEQATKAVELTTNLKKEINSNKTWMVSASILGTANLVSLILIPNIISAIFAIGLGVGFTIYPFCYIENKKLLKDIEKQNLFLKNKALINKPVENTESKQKEITINDVHNMGIDEVYNLVEEKGGIVDKPKILSKNKRRNS